MPLQLQHVAMQQMLPGMLRHHSPCCRCLCAELLGIHCQYALVLCLELKLLLRLVLVVAMFPEQQLLRPYQLPGAVLLGRKG